MDCVWFEVQQWWKGNLEVLRINNGIINICATIVRSQTEQGRMCLSIADGGGNHWRYDSGDAIANYEKHKHQIKCELDRTEQKEFGQAYEIPSDSIYIYMQRTALKRFR